MPTSPPPLARAALALRVLAALAGAAACRPDRVLTTAPTAEVPAEAAITNPVGARAAVTGMYNALQTAYGATLPILGDLSADNTDFTGVFVDLRDADRNALRADNGSVAGLWSSTYAMIGRANVVLARLPGAGFLDAPTRDQYLGEAYAVRALGHHTALKLWGAVPLMLRPVSSPSEAGAVVRADTGAVYRAVLADLDSAERLIGTVRQTRQASLGAARALRARVLLYRGDWVGALAAARAVSAMGYALAPNYPDLFSAAGADTPEDILRVRYTATDQQVTSSRYAPRSLGGRYEAAPSANLAAAYPPGDRRAAWTIATTGGQVYGAKFRSVVGTEHPHVIRLGEVLLVEAEALARLGRAGEAAVPLNRVRARAGVAPYVVTAATSPEEVAAAVIAERRLELALEGDRWPDMVRTDLLAPGRGLASAFLTARGAPLTQMLYPIPQADIDAGRGLTQNPGY